MLQGEIFTKYSVWKYLQKYNISDIFKKIHEKEYKIANGKMQQ